MLKLFIHVRSYPVFKITFQKHGNITENIQVVTADFPLIFFKEISLLIMYSLFVLLMFPLGRSLSQWIACGKEYD